MLQTLIQIGEKLREDKTDVAFLPFVEIGEIKEKFRGEKIIQAKPDVQIYDIYINDDTDWVIKKGIIESNANHPPVFVKGDNNDRFYIAGDINGNYFGANVSLKKYFIAHCLELEKNKAQLPVFIFNFRKTIEPELINIEKQIIEFNSDSQNIKTRKRIFVQFKFHKDNKELYWQDFSDELEKVGEFILKTNYIKEKGGKRYLKKVPISFFSEYNLNNLQYLKQDNSDKIVNINDSLEDVKNIIVSANYTGNKISYLGKALIQVLPAGEFDRNVLMHYLETPLLKRQSKQLEDIEQVDFPGLNLFTLSNAGIKKFDVLFLNRGAQTTDVISYISSIEISDIERIQKSWKQARNRVDEFYQNKINNLIESDKVKAILENEIFRLNPFSASYNLLKGFGKDDGKMSKYHRQLLYRIFRNQYFNDPLIIEGFIKKTEYGLRNHSKRSDFTLEYQRLILNYIYLDNILLNPKFHMMQDTKSFQAGKLLGMLARNIDQEINSFSRQYAGNISRRISTLEDMYKLLNFIQEKLTIHKKLYPSVRTIATELNELLAKFDEVYKRENAVAGFFYSYMLPFEAKMKEREVVENVVN